MEKKKIKLIIEITLFIIALIAITFIYYFGSNQELKEEDKLEVGIINVTDENFEKEVLSSDKPVVLEFYSNMCPPCLTMIPTMINLAKNNKNIKVATVNNSDTNTKEIVEKYEITATPTIIIFENGEIKNTFVGVISEDNILKALK